MTLESRQFGKFKYIKTYQNEILLRRDMNFLLGSAGDDGGVGSQWETFDNFKILWPRRESTTILTTSVLFLSWLGVTYISLF